MSRFFTSEPNSTKPHLAGPDLLDTKNSPSALGLSSLAGKQARGRFLILRCVPLTIFTVLIGLSIEVSPVQAGTFEVESNAELVQMRRKLRAAQFLGRATFGPKMDEIEALADRMKQIGVSPACEEWIDNQFALPATRQSDTILAMIDYEFDDRYRNGHHRYRHYA